MTFAAVGASSGGVAASFSLTPHAAGNIIVLEVNWATSTTTGASSSNATWAVIAGPVVTGARTSIVILGVAASTSAATVNLTTSGAPAFAWQEFSTTAGAANVLLDAVGTVNAAQAAYPSITPGHGAGELYFGYALNGGTASSGSTSGYTYNANVDGINDGLCFNPSCTSATQAPTWADSNTKSGIAVLLYEQAGATRAPLIPPGFTSPMNFRRRAVPSQAPPLVTTADTGTGADTGAGGPVVSGSDTGTGTDSGTFSLHTGDTGSGAEASSTSATLASGDTGTGADAGAARRLLTVRWSASDKLNKSGGTMGA